jgi:hypothetical protein
MTTLTRVMRGISLSRGEREVIPRIDQSTLRIESPVSFSTEET